MKHLFRDIRHGMEAYGACIQTIINSVLLCIIYILGVGVTAAIARIRKKHFLDCAPATDKSSHWIPLNLGKKPTADYYRQF